MPFTLNDACFFPFSRLFSSPLSFFRHPPAPAPHLLAKSYLSPLSSLFDSASILYSNAKYGLTSSVWRRGRLPVNCKFWPTPQFIWNGKSGKAIYWKWGASLNFPSFEKKFFFFPLVALGSICQEIRIEIFCGNAKYNCGKQKGFD